MNVIMPLAATEMDLEIVQMDLESEASQDEKEKCHMTPLLYVESRKK